MASHQGSDAVENKPSAEQIEHVESYSDDWRIAEDATTAKPSPWTARMFQLYLVLIPCFLCSCLNGYDGSLMSAINAMQAYYTFYGMKNSGSPTGITFVIYNIGGIAALPFTGPINDRLGRKWAMFIGCAVVIIGTSVQAPSQTMSAFLGGRFLLGFGATFCSVSAPTYVSEMAHPHWRGSLTGLYNVCWYLGKFKVFFPCCRAPERLLIVS